MQTSETPLALIVGGSSGIGKQSAIRHLNLGVEVMLLAHDPKTLENAKTELEPKGPVQTVSVDLSTIGFPVRSSSVLPASLRLWKT